MKHSVVKPVSSQEETSRGAVIGIRILSWTV